jgi:hypothetical protein
VDPDIGLGREVATVTFDVASLNVSGNGPKLGPNTYLADTGASSHMGPGDTGMFDIKENKSSIKIGDGKGLPVQKVGKRKGIIIKQANGSEIQITMKHYKQVPDLWVNLFSVTSALADGWKLGNDKKVITLTKGDTTIRFDKLFPSGDGYVCGVDIAPIMDTAAVSLADGATIYINDFHKIFNHASEETLKYTAQAHGIKLKGNLKPCFACKMANTKKPKVAKQTLVIADKIGERIYMDISSIKSTSYGGRKFWLLLVDDKSDRSWSFFLKKKSDLQDTVMTFLRDMAKKGTPVSFIRCDNAGENKSLKTAISKDSFVKTEFEFTPRDSPQYNGRVERAFADLWNRTRANLNEANFPPAMRNGLWAEAARFSELVRNQTVTHRMKDKGCPYSQYHGEMWRTLPFLKPFGTVAMVPVGKRIQSKSSDKGVPMVYVGPADDHAKDVCRFFSPTTKKVIEAKPSEWMGVMYGEWKGLERPIADSVGDDVFYIDDVDDMMDSNTPTNENTGETDEIPNPPPDPDPPEPTNDNRVLRAMRQLESSFNPDATDFVARHSAEDQPAGRDSAQAAIDYSLACLTMLDRLQLGPDELALTAMTVSDPKQIKPEQYKDLFNVPMTFEEAWNHPDPFQKELWRDAIMTEFSKMETRKVWTKKKISDIPRGRRLIKCKWVFDIKRNGRFRARLVACGYSQVGGIDFNQIYSPVVNDVTFRIMLIAKMVWKLDSMTFDVETAFLLGDLDEEIYMQCPPGMDATDDECLLLLQSIYGLVQAARQFWKKWAFILEKKLNFRRSAADPCLFTRGTGAQLLVICLYVDDGIALGKKPEILKFFEELKAEGITITTEETMGDYLSCEIRMNSDMTKAWLGQPHMVKKIEKTFGKMVEHLPKYKTPGTPGQGLVRPKDGDIKVTPEKQTMYRSGTGMLLYCTKHSRPDISNSVRELTKLLDGATPVAFKEMLRIIKFVLDTSTLGLRIEPKCPDGDLTWNLIVYSDSDWAGDKDNRRSVSGFVMFLCSVPIVWRSKQQKSVALSSSEAEFVAASEAVKEIIFVLQVLESMGIKVKTPVTVRVDNMGAIFMTENSSSGTRTRHIDTRWHFVRDLVDGKIVEIVFVKSAENFADGFTKNISTELHASHVGEYVWDRSEVGTLCTDLIHSGRVSKSQSRMIGDWTQSVPDG